MPSLYDTQIAHTFTKTTHKLARRDDDNGGLKESTKIGIAIGLICFATILLSFWFVWRCHRARAPPTEDDAFAQETYSRWTENILRPAHASTIRVSRDSVQTRRESNSTFATYTSNNLPSKADEYELSHPPQAHTTDNL